MLDQNTDRMWFVIGAVIVGAAIIFIANGTLPELFASVTESFEQTSGKATGVVSGMVPNTVSNLLINSDRHIRTTDYLVADYDLTTNDLQHGEVVTVTLKGKLHEDKNSFGIYNSGGGTRFARIYHDDFNDDGIAQVTVRWRHGWHPTDAPNDSIYVYALSSARDGGVDFVENELEWIRLERGEGVSIE